MQENEHLERGINPSRIYTSVELAEWVGRDQTRRLIENLERLGVAIVRVGSGIELVHGRDIAKLFGEGVE
jgi:hypothetical protein